MQEPALSHDEKQASAEAGSVNWRQWILRGLIVILLALQVYLLNSFLNPYPRIPGKPAAPAPVLFEEGVGQFSIDAKFKVNHKDFTVFFQPDAVIYSLPLDDGKIEIMEQTFGGSSTEVQLEGQDLAIAKSSYFIGNDPEKWITDVPNYATLSYQQIYPGIDLAYYGHQGRLKQDYVIAPGVDPNQINVMLSGIKGMHVDDEGQLVIRTLGGNRLVEEKPIAYQTINGRKVDVPVGYKLINESQYGFKVGDYDPNTTLIIDPLTTVYSTYLGGSGFEPDTQMAVDSSGNAYVSGGTDSTNFPTTGGAYDETHNSGNDVFVSKFDSTGSLVYSTYIGGANNDDIARDMTIDSSGNVYVAVSTDSNDYPTTGGAYDTTFNSGSSDIAVTKLNSTGSALVYSTYLGSDGSDTASEIVVDSSGNAYVGGTSDDDDYPTTVGAYDETHNDTNASGDVDLVISKLNSTGTTLTYSTFVGGEDGDFFGDMVLDSSNNVYFITSTESSNFPTTAGVYDQTHAGSSDLGIGKLNSAGSSLLLSTFVGGTGADNAYGIAVNSSDEVYFSGSTTSNDFPTANAYQGSLDTGTDGVFGRLNSTFSSLLNGSYYGGDGTDIVRDIQLDSANQPYMVLSSSSTDLTTLDEVSGFGSNQGSTDGFLAKFASDLTTLIFGTYFGGSSFDIPLDVFFDTAGNVYTFMITGSNDYPDVNAYQDTYGGGSADGGLTKLFFNDTPVASGVAITGTTTADDLDANYTHTDTDVGATEKATYDWRKGGTSIAIINGEFEADSSTASAAEDHSTYDQTMTVTGAVLDADGGVDGGGGYVFDGSDDKIVVTEDASLDMDSGFITIAAWINRAGVGIGGEQRILERSTNPGGDAATYNLKLDTSTSKVRTEIRVDFGTSSFTREVFSESTVGTGVWTHLATTYDGTQIKLYINGELDNSRVDIGTMDTDNNGMGLGIGNQVERNRPFHGTIDQVLLLDRALSQEQIQNLYNQRPDLMSDKETLVGEEWVACVSPTDTVNEGSEVCSSGVTLVTQPAAVCGDGYVGASESCDDANATTGDGCIDCVTSTGYSCVNDTNYPSECSLNWEDNKSSLKWTADYNVLDADASFLGDSADSGCLTPGRGGDLNGDGFNDIILGDCGNDQAFNNAGKVHVFFGKATGWTQNISVSTADASWLGDEASDFIGFNPRTIGDVNNDGYDDFAIDGFEPDFRGKVYVFFGKAAGWTTDTLLSTADASFVGEAASDSAAYIFRLGDVNNDGYDDFGIGANSRDEGPGSDDNGQFYLIFGRAAADPYWALGKDLGTTADASWFGEAVDDQISSRSGGVGDVNNDGFDDFIISATANDESGSGAGQAYLIFGRAAGDPYWAMDKNIGSTADASWLGETTETFDQFGALIAGNGDIDNDGFDDFILGSSSNDDGGTSAGQIYVIRGRPSTDSYWAMDKPIDTTADASYLGQAGENLSGFIRDTELEDLDKDGKADIVVSSYFNNDFKIQAGKVYVILGGGALQKDISITDTENGADASFFGEAINDFFGINIASLGDVNGDERPDFIVAATNNDQAANNAGKAYLFLSPFTPTGGSATPSAPPCPSVSGSIQNFTAQLGQSGNNSAIDLNWSASNLAGGETISLYRGLGEDLNLSQMLLIASNLTAGQNSYQNVFTKTSNYGKTYSYALQIRNSCGNKKAAKFSKALTLPNRYKAGTEINMTLELNVKIKEVRDQLLLDRIKEVLQNNGQAKNDELLEYIQSFRSPHRYLVAQPVSDINQFYFDLRSRIKDHIHQLFFPAEELITADPLKFDFYQKNKEFIFHKTVGNFAEADQLNPTDQQIINFLNPLVNEVLNEFNTARNKEQELRTKFQQEGLLSINPDNLKTIDDILNNPTLKEAILSIPNIENLIKGHSETVLLEVWNPGDRTSPIFSQEITTNIFGEASVTLPNFITGTYDFTIKLPKTLRKSVPVQNANTDTLVLNFSGDDAGLKFGDWNGDGQINLDDIKFLRTGFTENPDEFDLNEDGMFDLSDVFETLTNFGTE